MGYRLLPLLLLVALLFAGYVTLTPVGEAPDEAAHILYLNHLLQDGSLPPLPDASRPSTYEAHQPPLAYFYSAALLRALGVQALDYPFESNPDLDFYKPGSRAYLPPQDRLAASQEGRKVRLARWTNLLWVVLTAWALHNATQLARGRGGPLLAAWAFSLVPQFLFISGSVNNDAAVTAFSSLTALSLFKLALQEEKEKLSLGLPLLAGLSAGLALWSKSSGLFLLAPMAWTALHLWRRRDFSRALALCLSWALLAGLWLYMNLARFGSWWPPPPTGFSHQPEQGILRVLTEPGWVASLGISFWAKFGWLNTPLPLPLYILFAPASLLALWGGLNALRLGKSTILARLALISVAANLALLLGYMAWIDWQPQGRYLFPSLVPLAVLAATGWQDVSSRVQALGAISDRSLGWLGAAIAALGALAGLLQIAFSYN